MTIAVELIRWSSILLGIASAFLWLRAARVRSPEKVAATWDGGGPLQELADAVLKQSSLNSKAALAAAGSVLLQAVSSYLA
jgi:hypothetical protein